MVRQARIVDPADLRMLAQELRHRQRIAAVPLHAQVQRLDALQDLPGAQRRQRRAETRSVSMRARIVKPKSPKVS